MPEWFINGFGAFAQELIKGWGDAGDKLIVEGYFNRHVPERHEPNGLGSVQERAEEAEHTGSALDRFYDRLSPAERAEHFRETPEHGQGIDR